MHLPGIRVQAIVDWLTTQDQRGSVVLHSMFIKLADMPAIYLDRYQAKAAAEWVKKPCLSGPAMAL